MKLALLAVVTLSLIARPVAADISIVDNGKTIDVDCAKDKEVNLIGNHITITAKGVCTKITVTGNHETVTGSANVVYVAGNNNTVTIDSADDVTIAGNNNTLTVHKAVTLKAPKVSNSGKDNKVTQPK